MGCSIFWGKDRNKTQPEYDTKVGEKTLGEKSKALGLKAALRIDSKKMPSDEQIASVIAARDAALSGVDSTMRAMKSGVQVEPGSLFDSVALAGAAADKSRVVEGRWGKDADPGRLHGGTQPIREAELARFGAYLHREMTEPELYAKIRTLEPHQRSQWMANMFRASQVKGAVGGYMSFYVAAKLSGPYTLARATIGDLAMLPMDIASTSLGAQIGKIMPGEQHILPGEASIKATSYWRTMRDQISLLYNRDWDGIKQQMVAEGEWNPPIANASNIFQHAVNAVAGANTYVLGAERASTKIINRVGELDLQAHLQALREFPADQKKYVQAVEHYRRNPTAEMMKMADEHADAQAFTKRFDESPILGPLQKMGASNATKILVSPFPRIDIGILDMTLQGTPGLNFLSAAWRADVAAGGRARDKALGRTATGTAVIGTGMLMGLQGLVTGDGPSDPAQRKVWELAGWRPNYIYNPVTGKPLVSHLALGPISGWLAMGADLGFMLRHLNEHSGQQLMAGALHALGEPITHAGYLEAWSEVVDIVNKGTGSEAWLREVRRKIADITLSKPAIVSFINSETSPEGRPDLAMPRGDLIDREFKLLKDEITAGWPGWSKGFPNVKNFLTYEPIPRDGMMPWNKEVSKDVVANELYRLGNKVGGPNTIYAPPDHIGGDPPSGGLSDEKPTEGIRLEAWEKDRLLQIMATEIRVKGMTLHAAMADEMRSDKYVNAPSDEVRAQRMHALYTSFKVGAQGALLKEDEHLMWLVKNQKREQALAAGKDMFIGPKPEPTKYPRPSQTR
jgi:hypothetical protein